jgi:hypothetical protein
VFGPPPKPFSQRQNIFVRVFSCTWISRPITGSQLSWDVSVGLTALI